MPDDKGNYTDDEVAVILKRELDDPITMFRVYDAIMHGNDLNKENRRQRNGRIASKIWYYKNRDKVLLQQAEYRKKQKEKYIAKAAKAGL